MKLTNISLNGKVALVTGGDSGIGRITVRKLAFSGYHFFLAGLHQERMKALVDQIADETDGSARTESIELDLGDVGSIRNCVTKFLQKSLRLDLLINNAGVVGIRGKTQSGFEMTFGICYVGHFLLTQLLIDTLVSSAPARIINLASKVHRDVKRFDFDSVHRSNWSPVGFKQYRFAKLANILHIRELTRRLEGTGVTACAVHPGTVATRIWQNFPAPIVNFIKPNMLTPEQGAATTLFCATADDTEVPPGSYFEKCRLKTPSALALDPDLARELWSRTETWLAECSMDP